MPEGPEVKVIADELDRALSGKSIFDIIWDSSSRINRDGLPGFDSLRTKFPLKIEQVSAKGKKLIFHLQEEHFLVSSLGLEGHWSWTPEKHSNLRLEICQDDGFLAVMEPPVYFSDSRHFGTLRIASSALELEGLTKDVGPDLLSDDIPIESWRQKISLLQTKMRSGKLKERQICEFLMDQKNFSGIGNYLKAEILYAAKIRPDRLLTQLSETEVDLIFTIAREKILSSYQSKGLTIATYWSPTGNRGLFSIVVYNKEKDPFGNPVSKDTFADDRTTHWVPAVQK